jgi:hypothetical protein
MAPTQFPIVTICGSMRYYDKMLEAAVEWTKNGWIVLMPHDTRWVGKIQAGKTKRMLDDMHLTKISMSDRILVIGSHIGESTQNEIEYAQDHGTPVTYED